MKKGKLRSVVASEMIASMQEVPTQVEKPRSQDPHRDPPREDGLYFNEVFLGRIRSLGSSRHQIQMISVPPPGVRSFGQRWMQPSEEQRLSVSYVPKNLKDSYDLQGYMGVAKETMIVMKGRLEHAFTAFVTEYEFVTHDMDMEVRLELVLKSEDGIEQGEWKL